MVRSMACAICQPVRAHKQIRPLGTTGDRPEPDIKNLGVKRYIADIAECAREHGLTFFALSFTPSLPVSLST